MICVLILFGILIIYHFSKRKNISSIKILYHSNNYLVINKPYDMVVNSNDSNVKHTLQNEIKNLFPNLANTSLKHEFHFVHRLDYPTSGVICVALNKNSARAASLAFERRYAKKYYLALVHGHIKESFLIVNKAIGNDKNELFGNRKMCTSDDINCCDKARCSSTAILVLERGFRDGKPATKILLQPRTGRRHQLRVHCYHIGHTIIGDYTYSNRQDTEPHRTFLHSLRLILESDVEKLDVFTSDPFNSADIMNKWKPMTICRKLNQNTFQTIDQLFINI